MSRQSLFAHFNSDQRRIDTATQRMSASGITSEKVRAVAEDVLRLAAKHSTALLKHISTLPPSPLIFAASISAGCITLSYYYQSKGYQLRVEDWWRTYSWENKVVSRLLSIWEYIPYFIRRFIPNGASTKVLLACTIGMFCLNQIPSVAPVLNRHFTHVPKTQNYFLGIPYTLFTSSFNDVHWADATTTVINMYRLLPVLTPWVKPVDFWALILSSAVVSSTVSHYIHSDSLVPSFGASGIMAAVNTFLFMHVPDEFTSAAAPGVLAYLYRYRMQYFNTLMKADEEGKELADFSLPDFNFTTQIAGGVWGVIFYHIYKKYLHFWH